MRYYLIAGEASGDLHASNLMKELKRADQSAVFRCWGGDLMQQQGGELVKHYRDLAYMGFAEVVAHLPVIMRNFKLCESDLLRFKPDVLILVDYPGFNLRIAKFAAQHALRVFYYISPQLWAWNASRVKKVKAFVEKMFVILPFEQEFYARYNYHVDYSGHPLLDVINERMSFTERKQFLEKNQLTDKPIVALLPGSRKMEIGKMLKEMLSVRSAFPQKQFVVAAAPAIPSRFYEQLIGEAGVRVLTGQTYNLLRYAAAALVTSGTATLETALMGVPQVVCYKGSPISYLVAKHVVKVKYISLVNLITDKLLVAELIQNKLNPKELEHELRKILEDEKTRSAITLGYELLKQKLGGPGAAERTARKMLQYLQKK